MRRGEGSLVNVSLEAPTRAASHPHVQAVERPEVREKTQDVVGLYVYPPPMRSFSRSTRKPNPALDSHPRGLPMTGGRAGTMTHDYNARIPPRWFRSPQHPLRHLNRPHMQRPRHQEFIAPNTIEEQVSVGKVLHAIVDNYATHKPRSAQWWPASPLDVPLHPKPPHPGSMRSRLLLQAHGAVASSARVSDPSLPANR